MDRQTELSGNLQAVRQRVTAALDTAGRDDSPTLIVVTKFFPASDVAALAELGVRDVGENRDQEASSKAAQAADDPRCQGLRWHYVGQLQSNKAKSVVRYAAAVHSIDRGSLVKALDKAMTVEQQRRAGDGAAPRDNLQCFIQVNLDPAGVDDDEARQGGHPAGRGGVDPVHLHQLAARIDGAEHLDLAGVMAVAPLGGDPDEAFETLAGISAGLRARYPAARAISAGMSSDLEPALNHGATHLRVGSDVLGQRPDLR
ncbi:YggS family pyridoxal phosphate-dependent enzyme [Arthrobacter castelli]|uniref:YggS family pyridoxal phosphate-dependent enzyme n=1 Tax=Arthrobacter castelli TaxID=271431 RepID=UPI0004210F94|nr:YggS family pyridoxal phosphate-dependent enzyme [Arthrobacter castelli]